MARSSVMASSTLPSLSEDTAAGLMASVVLSGEEEALEPGSMWMLELQGAGMSSRARNSCEGRQRRGIGFCALPTEIHNWNTSMMNIGV